MSRCIRITKRYHDKYIYKDENEKNFCLERYCCIDSVYLSSNVCSDKKYCCSAHKKCITYTSNDLIRIIEKEKKPQNFKVYILGGLLGAWFLLIVFLLWRSRRKQLIDNNCETNDNGRLSPETCSTCLLDLNNDINVSDEEVSLPDYSDIYQASVSLSTYNSTYLRNENDELPPYENFAFDPQVRPPEYTDHVFNQRETK